MSISILIDRHYEIFKFTTLLTFPPMKQIAVVIPRSSIGNHLTKKVAKHEIKGPCTNPITIRVKMKPPAPPINDIHS